MADRPQALTLKLKTASSLTKLTIYAHLKSSQSAENQPPSRVRRSDIAIVEKGRTLNVPAYIFMSPLIYESARACSTNSPFKSPL